MKAKIVAKQIWRFSYDAQPDFEKADLRVRVTLDLRRAEDETEPAALIIVKLDIQAEDIDDLHVTLEDALELSFDSAPSDYKEALKNSLAKQCYKEACNDLDVALKGIGKAPMKLSSRSLNPSD